jgi:hypothetical protein
MTRHPFIPSCLNKKVPQATPMPFKFHIIACCQNRKLVLNAA